MTFALHPRLAAGAFPVIELPLSTVLLKDDCRWPWLLLAPRCADASELHDLSGADAATLMGEIRAASAAVAALPGVQKVNVGALGNQVRQLHVHVVGRWEGDPAWPDPVWGRAGKIAYPPGEGAALAAQLGAALRL